MDDILKNLNKEQLKAVKHNKGPLLILAGAGSGKTRVLTHRVAYLITEYNVNPWNIIALTFTNKAANEMRERIDAIAGGIGAENIWVSTFHSSCVRMLRRFGDSIGYGSGFSIYDADDSKSLMKSIIKEADLDTKSFNEKKALSVISSKKNDLITPEMYAREAAGDYREEKYALLYKKYQERLLSNNALDFDDLLMKAVELFETDENALAYYRRRFKYILVDEYQDTNTAQFELLKLLSPTETGDGAVENNICVVGDDDQSIYKFRGANIYNILNFEKAFPNATVIKLEQNYRSTKNILAAANGVIANNSMRKQKKLWCDNKEGSPIRYTRYMNDLEEAFGIVNAIKAGTDMGENYRDYAILYRTNAQSRVFEESLVNLNIPYKIVGGINFYSRKEIKDILAYLKTIDNGLDDVAVRRIINVPKRGIGLTTIDRIAAYADVHGISFYDALKDAEHIGGISISKSLAKINGFVSLIEGYRKRLADGNVSIEELVRDIISDTGYMDALIEEDTEESRARIENIEEFINKTVTFEINGIEDGGNSSPLSLFLENVALIADIDSVSEDSNVVLLMTMHGAKGLEFPHVFISGMEEGVFPSEMSIYSPDNSELEEERRLCYVGITRAMETLELSSAVRRMKNGETHFNPPSRFIMEIPRYLMNERPSGTFSQSISPSHGKQQESSGGLFSNNPYISKGVKKNTEKYSVSERVRHVKFGDGTITAVEPNKDDYDLTIDFDDTGVRKMKASYAKLSKII